MSGDDAVDERATPSARHDEPAPIDDGEYPRDGDGHAIVGLDVAGTVIFAVTAEISALTFAMWAQWMAAVTALVLFAIGVATFLWAHLRAVNRSRTEQIGVLEIFLMTGPGTPTRIKWKMLGLLGAQVVIACVTTFQRPNDENGKPGTSLALGFLVAMFGLGLNGLWVSTYGRFPGRRRRQP